MLKAFQEMFPSVMVLRTRLLVWNNECRRDAQTEEHATCGRTKGKFDKYQQTI